MQHSDQINEIATALAKAQAEIRNPAKDKSNPHFKSKYADIADGLVVARPALSKHGIAIVQATELDGDGVVLHTRLIHSSGQWIGSTYPVSRVAQHQQMGAALTYAKRQALFALVGIAGDTDDDDGNTASDPEPRPRREPPGHKAQEAARAEAETYVERAIIELGEIESVDRLDAWWGSEKKNRQLHFTANDDPLLVQLKAAAAKRKHELAEPMQEAAE